MFTTAASVATATFVATAETATFVATATNVATTAIVETATIAATCIQFLLEATHCLLTLFGVAKFELSQSDIEISAF